MVVSNLVPIMSGMFFSAHLVIFMKDGLFPFFLFLLFLPVPFFTLRKSFKSFSPFYAFIALITVVVAVAPLFGIAVTF